jgi:hypothetical protein
MVKKPKKKLYHYGNLLRKNGMVKKIQVVLDLEPRTDDRIWWLIIPHDERNEIQSIRDELVYLDHSLVFTCLLDMLMKKYRT